jgi:ubiquinone/menaquinone biosynthesis C-methylase UbiE
MKKLLRKIKRTANKILGTITDEFYWKFRHFFDKNWAESYISKESINQPYRKFLIDRIAKYSPLDSVLEIGCASGPNLYLLAKKFPRTKFYGIDISKKAIEIGTEFFLKENINNVFLSPGKAEKLDRFQDKSIDVIFTNATLIYEGPERIESLIKEILRVAKKSVVFCEQHSGDIRILYKDLWIYNYEELLRKIMPKGEIKLTKIPPQLLNDDWNWKKFGYLVEIKL